MKKILFFILSVLIFSACSDEIPEDKVLKRNGRTLLAYLVSNNNSGSLDKYLKNNLVDMYKGLASTNDSSALVVYYRPYDNDASLEHPSLLTFVSDGKGNVNGMKALSGTDLTSENVIGAAHVISYTEDNHVATSPEVMKRVLGDMIKLVPSKSYGLIFGSHGSSWIEGNSYKGRAFGDDNGYNIDIPDMAQAIDEAFVNSTLDFILFDACMMETAEVCYELKDVTDYIIGAVVETHVYGHPYDVILPKLLQDNVPYSDICDDYISYSRKKGAWGTCAVVDCSKMDDLASWIGDNLQNYSEKLNSDFVYEVQQYGVEKIFSYSFKYFSLDIVDFFRKLNDGTVPDGLQNLMDEVVIAKACLSGTGYEVVGVLPISEEQFCGIGMYYPYRFGKTNWDNYFESSISWYKAVGWQNYKEAITE